MQHTTTTARPCASLKPKRQAYVGGLASGCWVLHALAVARRSACGVGSANAFNRASLNLMLKRVKPACDTRHNKLYFCHSYR